MTRQDIEVRFATIVAGQLCVKPAEISSGRRFCEDLGADSLDQVELLMEVEERFGIEITDEDAEKIETVGEAIDYLAGRLA